LLANNIYTKYSTDYDLNSAVGSLNSLKNLGVNISDTFSKVLTANAQIKSGPINDVTSIALDLVNQGMSPEQAISQAMAQGAGKVSSPTEIANKTESQIASETVQGYANKSFTNDPKLTTGTTTPQSTQNTPQSTQTTPTVNNGSIVDYLNSKGQDSSYATRAKLAAQYGISNYTGSAQQNTQLLGILSSQTATKPAATVTTPPTSQPTVKTTTPVVTTPSTSNSSGSYVKISGVYFQQTQPGTLKTITDANLLKQLQSGQLSSTVQTSLGSNKLI
jgi:hypothetical protein